MPGPKPSRDREIRRVDDLALRRRKSAADSDVLLAELLSLENDFQQAGDELAAQTETLARREEEASELLRTHQETEARVNPWIKKVEARRADAIQKLAEVAAARNEQAKLEKEIELIRRQEEKLQARKTDAQERMEAKLRDLAARAEPGRRGGRHPRAGEGPGRIPPDAAEAAEAITAFAGRIAVLKNQRDETTHHLQALRKLEAKEREAAAIPEVPEAVGVFTDLVQSDPADAPLIDVFWKEEAKALVIDPDELLRALGGRALKGNFLLLPSGPDTPADRPRPGTETCWAGSKARLRPGSKWAGVCRGSRTPSSSPISPPPSACGAAARRTITSPSAATSFSAAACFASASGRKACSPSSRKSATGSPSGRPGRGDRSSGPRA